MKLASAHGRALVHASGGWIDVAAAGGPAPDVQGLLDDWDGARGWIDALEPDSIPPEAHVAVEDKDFDAPVTRPRQIFVVGLNYRTHAEEVGLAIPAVPVVVSKFPSSIASPNDDLELPSSRVDSEVEIVAVVGREATRIRSGHGLDVLAGLSVGQDYSERRVQVRAESPSLAKSLPGFTRFGPELVTVDELGDVTDLRFESLLNGEVMQSDSTSSMIFSIAEVVEYLSRFTTLHPGDVIFTGTPAGVGMARTPQRFLADGDELVSCATGIGTMRQRCVAAPVTTDLLSRAGA